MGGSLVSSEEEDMKENGVGTQLATGHGEKGLEDEFESKGKEGRGGTEASAQ